MKFKVTTNQTLYSSEELNNGDLVEVVDDSKYNSMIFQRVAGGMLEIGASESQKWQGLSSIKRFRKLRKGDIITIEE